MNKNRLINHLLFALLFITYLCCYQGVLKHIIFYQEQHQLFLFSESYFQEILQQEGLMTYATNFLIQFFYHPFLGSALLALFLALIYWLGQQTIFLVLGRRDIFQISIIPSIYLFLQTLSADYSLTPIVTTVVVWLLVFPLIIVGKPVWQRTFYPKKRSLHSSKFSIVASLVAILVYTGGTFYLFINQYNMREHRMIMTDQAVKKQDWKEVLNQTDRYFARQAGNQLMLYFRNLALYHQGQLFDHLLDHPLHMGVEALYFPWESNSRESEYGHYLYEQLGYFNEAQRWSTEAMIVWGETAPHLTNLIRYNLEINRPKVAQRFVNRLEQSLFYRNQAKAYQDQINEQLVEEVIHPHTHNQRPARFANVMNIGPELLYLCQENPKNKMAFEYLMCNLLLGNNVTRFVEYLPLYKQYDYNQQQLPRLFEEALLIYKLGVSKEEFAQLNITLSQDTIQRFQRYYELLKAQNERQLKQEFGNSYWYYLNRISPYGQKIINS